MRGFVIVLAALLLSSCATVQKLDAAGDVHALLISIRDGDRATFDQLVDRRALKQEMQTRLVSEARTSRVPAALAAVLAPSLASIAGDTLIHPDVFRAVAEYYGYRRDMPIPGPIGISTRLRPLDDGRVSGFAGDVSMLRLNR